jgi:type I restriction enzyme R subunit
MNNRFDEATLVLTRILRSTIQKLNPGLPDSAYDAAIRTIAEINSADSVLQTNQSKYNLVRDRVKMSNHDARGVYRTEKLTVIDFDNPESNHFLCVREFWVSSPLYGLR